MILNTIKSYQKHYLITMIIISLNNQAIFIKMRFHFLILFATTAIFLYETGPFQWFQSALWVLMAWCFSTRASAATMLSTHPCVSSHLWVKMEKSISEIFEHLKSWLLSDLCLLSSKLLLSNLYPKFTDRVLLPSSKKSKAVWTSVN